MYTEIEHNYSKQELNYILELIPKIRDIDFNISNELIINEPPKEMFDVINKQITLKANSSKSMSMSIFISMKYIKNINIAIISINYDFKNNLDLIEKLLLKEI